MFNALLEVQAKDTESHASCGFYHLNTMGLISSLKE